MSFAVFCWENVLSSARNNHVFEIISSSCSGLLENLISQKSDEIILETLSSGFITAIFSSLSIFTNSKFKFFVWTIWRTRTTFQALFNLATCSNYSITNYDRILVFHYFENVNKEHLKMLNVRYEKWLDFAILSF